LNQREPAVLVLAANDDNRRELADRSLQQQEKYPIRAKTPLGFFQDEIILLWPLLIDLLNLKAISSALRPETEQELATELWRSHLKRGNIPCRSKSVSITWRILDLLQLAAYSDTPIEEISSVLEQGLETKLIPAGMIPTLASLLLECSWCLERGLQLMAALLMHSFINI